MNKDSQPKQIISIMDYTVSYIRHAIHHYDKGDGNVSNSDELTEKIYDALAHFEKNITEK